MGFPSFYMKMPKCIGIQLLQNLLCYLRIVILAVLTHLPLLNQTEEAYTTEDETQTDNYVLITNRLCPTPVPVPVDVLTPLIKKRLAVKKFKNFGKNEDEEWRCSVCLDSVNNADEIRDLCNCFHVFHRECLDNWIDQGQFTCPICRSMLYPDNIFTERPGGESGL